MQRKKNTEMLHPRQLPAGVQEEKTRQVVAKVPKTPVNVQLAASRYPTLCLKDAIVFESSDGLEGLIK